ncbi:hypothetical protein I546_4225 [Mycobacterium kansasii 732]|uniref:Uncharacterized protein n=1 Tax=Mycobacterium kansasii TaxID=1768 RepID=A0A1V3XTJ8_MYCKA|nr:hypothetical protein I546_4225 [Mycobacterium kansasii 732]OOK82535.1 hypothetical protein BZL30_0263 [Mycobacterium kansasii]
MLVKGGALGDLCDHTCTVVRAWIAALRADREVDEAGVT